MKAKKVQIRVLSAEDVGADSAKIGLAGSPTQVVDVFPPHPRGERSILTGTIDEQIEQLVEKLAVYL